MLKRTVMGDEEILDEVLELTLCCQLGRATDEERARLERLLADSEAARRHYIAVVDDTVTMTETAAPSQLRA